MDNLKFQNVFRVLSSGKFSMSDDAMLLMLLDMINKTVSSVKAIHSCGLKDFVSMVVKDISSHENTIVTFCVQLLGWLSSDTERYETLFEFIQDSFRSVLTEKEIMRNMSVVTALYNSLEKVVMHSSGLLWILSNGKGFLETAYSLLTPGSSMFVKKAATTFLSSVLVQSSQRCGEDQIFQDHVTDVVHKLHTVCCESTKAKAYTEWSATEQGILVSQLSVLEMACRSCDQFCHKVVTSTKLVDDVSKTMEILNGPELQLAIDVIKHLLPKCGNDAVTKSTKVLSILLARGELKKCQRFAVTCMSTLDDVDKNITRKLLLLPVQFVLGEMEVLSECHMTGELVQSNMRSKSQQTDMLCHSLECLVQGQILDVVEVCHLFEMTSKGETTPDKPASCHVTSNRRVQRACMQYLALFRDAGNIYTTDIVSTVLEIMNDTGLDSLTYSSSIKCLQRFLPHILGPETKQEPTDSKATELAFILQRHLCSLQWELRDTTLEFLREIIQVKKHSTNVVSYILCHRLHVHIWQCLTDGNSYVRATAISTVAILLAVTQLWTQLLTSLEITEEAVIAVILGILETDTEAFPRRAAAAFMLVYYQQKVKVRSEVIQPVVMETMVKTVDDFDWEVKHEALTFLETVIGHELSILQVHRPVPAYVACMHGELSSTGNTNNGRQECIKTIDKLKYSGVFKALFSSVNDYDQNVCEKACNVLHQLRDKLKMTLQCDSLELKNICHQVVASKTTVNHADSSITCGNVEHKTKRIKVDHNDTAVSTVVRNQKSTNLYNFSDNIQESLDGQSEFTDEGTALYETVQRFVSFDISEYSQNFSSTSDYAVNPESLLDDILLYGRKRDEDNVVDCY